MDKCLLSIDWDYFIYTRDNRGTHLENTRSMIDLWYKKFLQAKARGEDMQKAYRLSPEVDAFWPKIKKRFKLDADTKAYVSDSHALSYKIAKEENCTVVYLFDAHADLGYGGLSSLNFEVNCSNWLGKLLKEGQINEANIFYSPYTVEKPEYFNPMNSIYNIRYLDFSNFKQDVAVSAIHVCRSGAWTPPWLDNKFKQFIDGMGIPYKTMSCPERKWDPDHISFSDQINYLMA
ncbi:MAG: arginase [Firmicutes bacterium]|nr:arginase [Bacillota bacterium]